MKTKQKTKNKKIEQIEKMDITYSEKSWNTKSIKRFLKAREQFEKLVDNTIDNYFKNKPKIIKVLAFNDNPNHYCVITEDEHTHDIQVVFKNFTYHIEIKEF